MECIITNSAYYSGLLFGKRLLFLSALLCLITAPALFAQSSLMQVSRKTADGLSSNQRTVYDLLTGRGFYKNIYLVETAKLPDVTESNTILLDLPFLPCPQLRYIATRTDSTGLDDGDSTALPDTYVWQGRVAGATADCAFGELTLVNSRGVLAGSFNIGRNSYEVYDLGEGIQAVAELDYGSEALAAKQCATRAIGAYPLPFRDPPPECDRLRTKVLVLYTDEAMADLPSGNMTATAQLGIAQLNAVLANSEINHTVSLAAVRYLPGFVEGDNIINDVNALATNTIVHTLRDQYKAELVVLLSGSEYGNNYGYAKEIGGVKEDAYAIVDIMEATNHRLTFAHEIGHLYGARHNDDPEPGTAHGYIFNAGSNELRTIMAQTDGYFGSRISYLSNPNIQVQGTYAGTAAYNNNRGKVYEMVHYVAGFYPDPSWTLRVEVSQSTRIHCQSYGTATAAGKCGWGGYSYKWYTTDYATGAWVLVSTGPTVNTSVAGPANGYFNSRPYRVTVTDGLGRSASTIVWALYDCWNFGYFGSADGIHATVGNSFSLYPNPAKGSLNIELYREDAGKVSIELLDISGKKVQTLYEDEALRGLNTITADINGYAKGIYFIRLDSPGCKKTAKLIIQ